MMLFGETPFRLEELRVWPVLRIVMYHVQGNIDQHSWKKYHLTTTSQSKLGGTFGNEQPVVMPIFCAHSVIPRDRGEDPQSLFDARLQVGHVRDGLVVQPPPVSLKDLINLLDKSLLHILVHGKVVGEGGEGAGGCLEAGEQEDD